MYKPIALLKEKIIIATQEKSFLGTPTKYIESKRESKFVIIVALRFVFVNCASVLERCAMPLAN